MLPVSSWPPGPPGASLSPFGPPRDICVPACGYVLPKGAWVVQTTCNQVVMFRPSWKKALYTQPRSQMGTGYLPGFQQWASGARWSGGTGHAHPQSWKAGPRPTIAGPATAGASGRTTSAAVPTAISAPTLSPHSSACGPPCAPKKRWTHDQRLEAWRAWQRKTGNTDPPIRPLPGRVPPNFAGWNFVGAPSTVLVPFASGGTVLADGQNVVITGGGWANITQAYSV